MGNSDDTTIVLTDIKSALQASEKEAAQKPAAFLVMGGELNGTLFDLVSNEIIIGRSANCQIALDFNGISRQHFRVVTSGETHSLEDMGSRNGTFINNRKLEGVTLLSKGDIVKIGSITLKYLPKGDPERLTYDKLHLEANTDKHTGCFNKAYFNNQLTLLVNKSKVTGEPLSLVILDLDHFKKLNDNRESVAHANLKRDFEGK